MRKLYLFLALLCVGFALQAQQTTFRIQYDVAIFDLPGGIIQNPAGSYVFSGTNASFGTTGHLFQVNANGIVTWSKAYSAGGLSTQFADVKNVTGGGYVVTGGTGSGCLIMKVDNNGNLVWANRYRVGSGSNEYGNRVIETSDGGFVVAGSVNDVDPDGAGALGVQDSSKMFAMKVNSAGTMQWMRTFFYTTAFDDDDYLQDVAEVADGYVFTGYATIVGGDGQSDAVILKTNTTGTLQWAHRWGNSNSESGYAIINNGSNQVVIAGDDNARAFLLNVNTPNTGPTTTGTNSIYTTAGFAALGSSLVKTKDNQFTLFGTRIGTTFTPPFLDFSAFIMKTNAGTGAVTWSRTYNSGFVSILPVGLQASDTGYVMNSLSAALGGGFSSYDYGVVKTDVLGLQNASLGCPPASPTFSRSNYAPTFTAFTPTIVTTGTTTGITPTVANVGQTTGIVCQYIQCTAPPQPTVTATGNNVCPGTQVTINASGGTNVTYRVYTQATNGTSIGTAPLNVNPTTTTTYYVAADDNTNPGCVSTRGQVTVTVIQPPAAVGAITGPTSPCPGPRAYSIGAVSGATSYTWAVPGGGGSVTGGQGTTNATVTWTTAGTYTVTVTATNTCGSTSATLAVNVQAGPPTSVGSITGSTNPCPGTQAYSIGNVTNATTYTWSVSGGGTIASGQGTTGISVNWTTSGGPYTVSVVASNSCGSVTGTVNVNVQNAAPGTLGNITGPATPCLGSQTYSVTGVSGSPTYTWSVSGGGTISSGQGTTSINVNWATAGGPYTVSVTASNACGNNSKTLAVTVSAGVSGVAASASPNPACVGDAVTLNGTGNGVTTWSWSGPNSYSSSAQSPNISSITAAGAGIYTLTASSSCGTATATVNVVVNNVPQAVTASATPNPACAGQTILFTGSGTGAASWAWAGPNSFASALQNPSLPNAQVNATGVYTLTATNACGNTPATVTLTVNEPPTAVTATGTPNPVCEGTTLNLSGSATGATAYAWSGPNTFSSTQLNETVSNFQQANAGTYTLAASNTCGTTTATVNVTMATVPTNVSATAAQTNLCFGSTLTLNGSATGATSWAWSGPNGFSSTQQNPSTANVTLADSGTYTLTATNSCGSTPATILVDIDTTIENVNVTSAPDDTICTGGSINLTATGDNVNNWSWTGPNNFTSAQQSPTIPTATAVNSGTYIVTASNACNDVIDSLYVLVNTIPITPGTINGSLTACGSDTATYTVTGISNATSYNWTVSGGGTILSGQGTTSIDVLWGGATGNYTVSVTAGNNCGNSSATSITVNVLAPAPVMNTFIIGDTAVCPGSYPYNITNIPNATGYTWTVSNGGTISSGQGTTSVNVNWSTAGAQTLSVVATNTCGNSSAASVNVTVFPAPTTPAITVSDDTICEGSSTTLTGSNSSGGTGISYHFYDAATGGNMYASHPLTVSPTQTTTYYLEVINSNGCTASSGRVPVTVYVIPAPAVLNVSAESDSVCFNTGTTLTATATAGSSITWWDSPIGGNQLGSGNTYTVDSLQFTTTYYVQATSTGGCQNLQGRVPVTVGVIELPVVTLTTDKDQNIAFPNEAITFTASPDGYANYEFFVNGESVQSGTLNTWASAKLSDKDTVSVVATGNGCASVESEVVVTIADFPNAFTPNGDAVNDVFLKDYELLVLNRWGQKLYEGIEGWDGTFNGDKVSAGTYYYIVTLKNITDRDSQIKGTVLLIQE